MEERSYALIYDGVVENVIAWDGVTPYEVEPGYTLIEVTGTEIWIGWHYSPTGGFTPPKES